MGQVVDGGAEAGVEEIAEHEEVGCKEEDCEGQPTVVEMLVGEEGKEEEDGFFNAEEDRGAGQHGWLIWGCGGHCSRVTETAKADSFAVLRNNK